MQKSKRKTEKKKLNKKNSHKKFVNLSKPIKKSDSPAADLSMLAVGRMLITPPFDNYVGQD